VRLIYDTETSAFIAALKRSKIARIETAFYQQGNEFFEFSTGGLNDEGAQVRKDSSMSRGQVNYCPAH
jgi:hypothetical protein